VGRFAGIIAGAIGVVALATAMAVLGACGDSSKAGLDVSAGDAGADDAAGLLEDGGAGDGTVTRGDDAGGELADAGMFSGLHCASHPCVVALAVGGNHACALLVDHTVRCWGENASGEVGAGFFDGGAIAPALVAMPTVVAGVSGSTQIAAGGYGMGLGTSCATASDGGVVCWGSNGNGALGLGANGDAGTRPTESLTPLPLALDSVAQVSLGGLFGCALTNDGGVACWGDNSENELGRTLEAGSADPTPTVVPLPQPATAVTTGKYHACALLADRSVVCWGAGDHGAIGQLVDGGVATPSAVNGIAATGITAGEVSTCAIVTDGGVVCWGGNQGGQLGRGNVDAGPLLDPAPQPVALPPGTTALQLASAVGSTCALLSDRSVWCWGDNAYGELGTGSAVPGFSSHPMQVMGLSNIVQVASGPGGWTVCALLDTGSARCWGVNNADQLAVDTSGDAGPDESPHPVPVTVSF
jgi:alpha-tubulin suppressor-like RCC1 family protein